MTLIAPKPKRVLPPEGTHIATCVRIIHIGTVSEEYMGEEKLMNKVELMFELPDELHVFKEGDDAKPFVIAQKYTLSMGEKANLRKIVEGMIGTTLTQEETSSFDIESLLGKACLITIKYKTSKAGNQRAEIATASPLMKGQSAKTPFNIPKLLTYEKWDEDYFEGLPEFMREEMASSQEYQWMKNPTKGAYPSAEKEGIDLNKPPFED